jgi:hypothetical protein
LLYRGIMPWCRETIWLFRGTTLWFQVATRLRKERGWLRSGRRQQTHASAMRATCNAPHPALNNAPHPVLHNALHPVLHNAPHPLLSSARPPARTTALHQRNSVRHPARVAAQPGQHKRLVHRVADMQAAVAVNVPIRDAGKGSFSVSAFRLIGRHSAVLI